MSAAAGTELRHAAGGGAATAAHLPRRWWSALAVGACYAAISRIGLLAVTAATMPLPQAGHLGHTHAGLWHLWSNWDGRWYAAIALGGYRSDRHTLAFFPLLPALEGLFRAYAGGQAAAVGVIVAALSSVVAFALLYERLCRIADGALAERAVRYLALFPTGFFLAAAYPEPLFLALALGCMRALDGRRWTLAAGLGALAALTRNGGVLLLLPAAWAVHQARIPWRRAWPLLLIPGALLGFMAFEGVLTHDPLAFLHVQAMWRRHLAWPWWTLAAAVRGVLHGPDAVSNATNLASALLAVAALVAGRRWLPVGDQIFGWAVIGISIADPARAPAAVLLSMERFIIVVYPVFAVLARWGGNRLLDRALSVAMPMAQAGVFVLFLHGYFVA